MLQPVIRPILHDDLPRVCTFLHEHLNAHRSVAEWVRGLRGGWIPDAPNHGFAILAGEEIGGVVGALYAEPTIRGRRERLCNITSWCVLEEYRRLSLRLLQCLLAQPGYHFTDFTPTEAVGRILKFFGFEPLSDRVILFPNSMDLRPGTRVTRDPVEIDARLEDEARRVHRDHRSGPWIHHGLAIRGSEQCYVIHRRRSVGALRFCHVLWVSDVDRFSRLRRAFGSHVLLNYGMVGTWIAASLLPQRPALALEKRRSQVRMYRSATLAPDDIDELYSELVVFGDRDAPRRPARS